MRETLVDAYFSLPFDWQPAASEKTLAQAAQTLKMQWLPELKALYQRHDGAPGLLDDWEDHWAERLDEDEDIYPSAPRLMSLAEVGEIEDYRQEFYPDLRFFWTNDQSSYVAVYVEGPLEGMVTLLNLHDPSVVPCFRTVSDFLTRVVSAPEQDILEPDNLESTTETYGLFPKLLPDPIHDAEDWARAQACYAMERQRPDSPLSLNPYLECALSMTPAGHNEALVPYLDDQNFYVTALAVEILGKRRYEPARKKIEELAQSGTSNAKTTAQTVLADW